MYSNEEILILFRRFFYLWETLATLSLFFRHQLETLLNSRGTQCQDFSQSRKMHIINYPVQQFEATKINHFPEWKPNPQPSCLQILCFKNEKKSLYPSKRLNIYTCKDIKIPERKKPSTAINTASKRFVYYSWKRHECCVCMNWNGLTFRPFYEPYANIQLDFASECGCEKWYIVKKSYGD